MLFLCHPGMSFWNSVRRFSWVFLLTTLFYLVDSPRRKVEIYQQWGRILREAFVPIGFCKILLLLWERLQHAQGCQHGKIRSILRTHSNNVSFECIIAVPHIGGTTPLHLATQNNHMPCIKELILNGSDYNAVDQIGRTSLYIAAEMGLEEAVLTHLRNAIGKDILSLPVQNTGTVCFRLFYQTKTMQKIKIASNIYIVEATLAFITV